MRLKEKELSSQKLIIFILFEKIITEKNSLN
jgi:hypothetical protein